MAGLRFEESSSSSPPPIFLDPSFQCFITDFHLLDSRLRIVYNKRLDSVQVFGIASTETLRVEQIPVRPLLCSGRDQESPLLFVRLNA
jgi:hypothetical protein